MVANHYSDEQLTSYLDNEMDADERRALQLCLEEDEDLRQRVADLDKIKEGLQPAFHMLLSSAPELEHIDYVGFSLTSRK